MRGFRIGRVFGIDIRVDWSWLFIFLLLTWNLTTAFTYWHPDWAVAESIVVAVAASLIFFGCILVHELAHAGVASAYHLRVRSITLFLFGGVSDIEHEPTSPRAELLTALAGPAASILLGLWFLFMMLAWAATPAGGLFNRADVVANLGPIGTLLAWLGPINIIIGVFNLIPAFPLDGGRVLRSILWSTSGDLRTSTRRASFIGQLFGWLFIVLGIAMAFGVRIPLFGSGVIAGLWLAFIGWFLHSASSTSYRRIALDDALAGHTVEEVMRRTGPVVPPELPVETLVRDYLVQSDDRALPVVRDGRLVGLVSISDVRTIPPSAWPTTPVEKAMRPDESLIVARPDEPLSEAFDQLARQDVGQLPVIDHGHLVGMLQRRDLTRWLELTWGPTTAAPGFGAR
ncbi:MAG TPA: site-2 protease family protein [Polyangiaceae bacterium]|jgi:Zn-dependent protease